MRCKLCINSSENPSRTFDENGVCNVCREFKTNFSQAALDAELSFLKTLIRKDGSTDCLVALSGGKDSAGRAAGLCGAAFKTQLPLPATISVISWVMAFWRARMYCNCRSSIITCAFMPAESMAVRRAATSQAKLSRTACTRRPAT